MPHTRTSEDLPFADLRVLIVEDQSFQRQLLTGLLTSCGVRNVAEAEDGTAGLKALDEHPDGFDIAIVDLKMEGMDGIEFIRHAAKRKVQGFIVTSALEPTLLSYVADLGDEFGAIILGTLPKPVLLDHMVQQLDQFMQRDRLGGPNLLALTAPAQFWTRQDLSAALKNDEFVPFFQPKVDLITRRPVGVEILARWDHPVLGLLPPLHFIERMEAEGLIDELTERIVSRALACSAEWGSSRNTLSIAVNMSPLTLQNLDIAKHVLSFVKKFRTSPELITIEVTETAVSQNTAGLLETLTRLRMQGFNIAVDDFGTGYSSLLQLSEMPFNEIKIDRTFVHGSRHSAKATIILESIIQLALKLGTHIVAEGIETEEELVFIRELGCPTGQGFHLAHPMSQADLLQYLSL